MERVILFDVDGTVANGRPIPETRARPGVRLVFGLLHSLGYQVHLWSKAGEQYAREIANYLGLIVDECHTKPQPATEPFSPFAIGLQVDNNPDDQIDGAPFHCVESWWGDPPSEEIREAHEDVGKLTLRCAEVLEALRETYSANQGDRHYTPNGERYCVECNELAEDCWARKAREVVNA